MSKFIQVQWTAAHLDEAREITALLISRELIASSSIIPLVESWFEWKGELQQESEVKVFMKTLEIHYPRIEKLIVKHHTYKVPEIIVLEIIQGYDKYLDWIEKSIRAKV